MVPKITPSPNFEPPLPTRWPPGPPTPWLLPARCLRPRTVPSLSGGIPGHSRQKTPGTGPVLRPPLPSLPSSPGGRGCHEAGTGHRSPSPACRTAVSSAAANLLSLHRPPFPPTSISDAQLLPDTAAPWLTSLPHRESRGHRWEHAPHSRLLPPNHQACGENILSSCPEDQSGGHPATLPRGPTPRTSRGTYRKLGGSSSSLRHEPRPRRDGLMGLSRH